MSSYDHAFCGSQTHSQLLLNQAELSSLIACHECDALHERRRLDQGQTAYCQRCGAKLYAMNRNYLQRTLAFAVAGLVFFGLMISYPFLGISIKGVVREVSLLESIVALYQGDSWMLAILVGMVLIIFPLLKVLGLISLLLPLQMNRRLPGGYFFCKTIERVWPWNMTEIYLVGVIVTFVKLSSMATIIYGTAFWVFIAFVIAITAAKTTLNFTTLWDRLDPV